MTNTVPYHTLIQHLLYLVLHFLPQLFGGYIWRLPNGFCVAYMYLMLYHYRAFEIVLIVEYVTILYQYWLNVIYFWVLSGLIFLEAVFHTRFRSSAFFFWRTCRAVNVGFTNGIYLIK